MGSRGVTRCWRRPQISGGCSMRCSGVLRCRCRVKKKGRRRSPAAVAAAQQRWRAQPWLGGGGVRRWISRRGWLTRGSLMRRWRGLWRMTCLTRGCSLRFRRCSLPRCQPVARWRAHDGPIEAPGWYRCYDAAQWDEPDEHEIAMTAGWTGPWPAWLHDHHSRRRWAQAKYRYERANPAFGTQQFDALIASVRERRETPVGRGTIDLLMVAAWPSSLSPARSTRREAEDVRRSTESAVRHRASLFGQDASAYACDRCAGYGGYHCGDATQARWLAPAGRVDAVHEQPGPGEHADRGGHERRHKRHEFGCAGPIDR